MFEAFGRWVVDRWHFLPSGSFNIQEVMQNSPAVQQVQDRDGISKEGGGVGGDVKLFKVLKKDALLGNFEFFRSKLLNTFLRAFFAVWYCLDRPTTTVESGRFFSSTYR